MSEYERLTYYLDEQCTMLVMPQRKERIKKYIERLAELEDKIESGKLIDISNVPQLGMFESGKLLEPPCKIGDTIYRIVDWGSVVGECIDIKVGKVDEIRFKQDGILIHADCYDCVHFWYQSTDIGKTVFLTKEQAEARLKELQENKK